MTFDQIGHKIFIISFLSQKFCVFVTMGLCKSSLTEIHGYLLKVGKSFFFFFKIYFEWVILNRSHQVLVVTLLSFASVNRQHQKSGLKARIGPHSLSEMLIRRGYGQHRKLHVSYKSCTLEWIWFLILPPFHRRRLFHPLRYPETGASKGLLEPAFITSLEPLVCTLANFAFNHTTLVAWNWPYGEYLYHRNRKMLLDQGYFSEGPVILFTRTFLVYCIHAQSPLHFSQLHFNRIWSHKPWCRSLRLARIVSELPS